MCVCVCVCVCNNRQLCNVLQAKRLYNFDRHFFTVSTAAEKKQPDPVQATIISDAADKPNLPEIAEHLFVHSTLTLINLRAIHNKHEEALQVLIHCLRLSVKRCGMPHETETRGKTTK